MPGTLQPSVVGPALEPIRAAWLEIPWLGSPRLLTGSAAAGFATVLTARAVLSVSWSCAGMTALFWAIALTFAALEPRRERLVSLNLFSVGFTLNALALLSLTWWSRADGGPFLGPDSSSFLQGAMDVAHRRVGMTFDAVSFFQSFNIAQFYLFGDAIRWMRTDLYGLQTLNVGLIALTGPVTFAIARGIARPFSRVAGLIVPLHPSLIALCAVDLLKDPSIVLSMLLAAWGLIEAARAERVERAAMFAALSVPALLYLRTGRFFVFTYFEAAAATAAVWLVIRGNRRPTTRSISVAGIVAVAFLTGEFLPMASGWPLSPQIFMLEATNATNAKAVAAAEAAATSGVAGVSLAAKLVPPKGEVATKASGGGLHLEQRRPAPQTDSSDFSIHTTLRQRSAANWSAPVTYTLTLGLNIGRRFLGPFPWIAPASLDFGYLQSHAILMYPGILFWYGLLPLLLAGCVAAAIALWKMPNPPFGLVFLWAFAGIYLVPYTFLDFEYLPYRQRDDLFPILLLIALGGLTARWSRVRLRRWYAGVLAALLVLATSHLAIRAWFVS